MLERAVYLTTEANLSVPSLRVQVVSKDKTAGSKWGAWVRGAEEWAASHPCLRKWLLCDPLHVVHGLSSEEGVVGQTFVSSESTGVK